TLASVGFIELHTSDTAASRRAIVATSTAITGQRTATIAAAQLAANTATKAREAECAVRGPRCRDREADERTAIAALASSLAAPARAGQPSLALPAQPPAAVGVANGLGFDLTAAGVMNLRLAIMATLPNIAGLLLAFGNVLRGRTT